MSPFENDVRLPLGIDSFFPVRSPSLDSFFLTGLDGRGLRCSFCESFSPVLSDGLSSAVSSVELREGTLGEGSFAGFRRASRGCSSLTVGGSSGITSSLGLSLCHIYAGSLSPLTFRRRSWISPKTIGREVPSVMRIWIFHYRCSHRACRSTCQQSHVVCR